MNDIAGWLRAFLPPPIHAGWREKIYGAVGAWIGLFFTALLSKLMLGNLNPWFIAPMGASAVLLFAVPSSPLAQPWSLIGGNIVSALIGVTCAKLFGDPMLAASIAASIAIGAMFALRCLHPPSGAVALTAVLGGPAVLESGYRFVLWPVGVNSLFLLIVALCFNNLLRRRYPHAHAHPSPAPALHQTNDPLPTERLGFTRADLDQALKTKQELLDVDPDDLEDIFLQAELNAYRRRFGKIHCADLMSKDVITIHPSASLELAWKLLAQHKIKALPVVDTDGNLVGIVSLHDLMLGRSVERTPAELVEKIMTRQVKTVSPEQSITELVPLFSDAGYHHIPVVDGQSHLIGIVTQSDLIAALYRAHLEETALPS